MLATLTSLDKDKFHILGVEGLSDRQFGDLAMAVQEVLRNTCNELQLILVPFAISSIASRPLTKDELRGFKESIEEIAKDANTRS